MFEKFSSLILTLYSIVPSTKIKILKLRGIIEKISMSARLWVGRQWETILGYI